MVGDQACGGVEIKSENENELTDEILHIVASTLNLFFLMKGK